MKADLNSLYNENGFVVLSSAATEINVESLMEEILNSHQSGRIETWSNKLRVQTKMLDVNIAKNLLLLMKRIISPILGDEYRAEQTKWIQEFASLTSYPGCESQGWHRDSSQSEAILVTCFFNLYPTSFSNGALQVIPKSHRKINWLERLNQESILTLEVPCKSLILMDSRLIHRGGANTSLNEIRPVVYSSWGHSHLSEPGYILDESLHRKYFME